MSDPLAALARRPGIAEAAAAGLAELDSLTWRRDVRAKAAEVARSSLERGARDSAAIDGADVVAPDTSPMGRVLAGAIAATAEVPSLVPVWGRAPAQALARLHTLAASTFVPEHELGRPRSGDEADDPLSIGAVPPASEVPARLAALTGVAASPAPAVLVAAIVHAELMALRPFSWGSGIVARAAVRLVLAERSVDPSCFSIPERGMLDQGRPAAVRAVRDYATGTPEGTEAMVRWFAASIALGAQAVSV